MKVCVLSNVMMLFPAFVAYRSRLYRICAAIMVAMVLSMLYHVDEQRDIMLFADIMGVVALSATINFILMRSRLLLTPINLIGLLYWFAALYCYFQAGDDTTTEEYEMYHTAWHVLGAYFTTCIVYSHCFTTTADRNTSRMLARELKWEVQNLRRLINAFMGVKRRFLQVTTDTPGRKW